MVSIAGVGLAVQVGGRNALAQQFQDQTAARFPAGPNEYTNQVTIGDIDSDGDMDLIWANGQGYMAAGALLQMRVFINNGSGVFTDESVARAPGAMFIARGVELGDVDGDTDLDLIVAQDFAKQPQLLINNGSGFFTNETAARFPIILLGSARGQLADVDNDGDLDAYFISGGASRWGTGMGRLFINNGSGFFTDETVARMPAQNTSEPQDMIFGDIDGDYDLDIRIGSTQTNNGRIYKNNGAGVFAIATAPSDNNTYSYDFGDMDGDGDLDMLGANSNPVNLNSELLLRNNGSGTYSSAAFPIAAIDDNDSKFIDYDNDGDRDLIVASLGSTERVYSNNGTGTFTLVNGLITAVADASLDIKTADLNGDGRLDLVTAQGESGSFVNRIYMNVTGPPDSIAPVIVKTEQVQNTLDTAGPYNVRTVVYDSHSSDRGFHPDAMLLKYSVDGGPTLQVNMKWVGNSVWRGSIPGQASGSKIAYFVSATDHNNNTGTGPTQSFNILFPPCPSDISGDQIVNVVDMLAIINAWGQMNVTHEVAVSDTVFAPSLVNAKSGDTVRWNWVEGIHTITSGSLCTPNGQFNQALSSGFWEYNIPQDFVGSIPYYCAPHCAFGMEGSIDVGPFKEDINGDGIVNVGDLLAVINAWGNCPQ
jgi:plastocyanin